MVFIVTKGNNCHLSYKTVAYLTYKHLACIYHSVFQYLIFGPL